MNAENGNLPAVNFITHSDQKVVIPKQSYVGVGDEKVQESNQDIYHADTSPEPVNQCALSKPCPKQPSVPPTSTKVRLSSGKL